MVVPGGRYQIVVSPLGMYGDAGTGHDLDVVESPIFHLKYFDESDTDRSFR